MAITLAELNILLKLKGLDSVQTGLKGVSKSTDTFQKSIKDVSRGLNQFAVDMNRIGLLTQKFGLAVTGVFGTAFALARKDLQQVDSALKNLKRSFDEISKSLAVAALPVLNEFSKILSSVAGGIQRITRENPQFFQTILKLGGLAVVLGTIERSIALVTRALSSLIRIFTVASIQNMAVAIVLLPTGLSQIADQIEKILNLGSKMPAWLIQLLRAGPFGVAFTAAQGGKPLSVLPDLNLTGIQDNFGRFVRGIRSEFKNLAENMEQFGKQIGRALDTAFGETIFQAITGRIKGLRSILISFAEDIAGAFSQRLANTVLGGIIGTGNPADFGGGKGLVGNLPFGGIASKLLGGGGGKDRSGEQRENLKLMNMEFAKTTQNLQLFQESKDRTIQNFRLLDTTLKNVGQASVDMTNKIGLAWGQMTIGIAQNFDSFFQGLFSWVKALLSMIKGAGGGIFGKILGIGGLVLGAAAGLGAIASIGRLKTVTSVFTGRGAAPLPAGAGVETTLPSALQHGGIIRKPTLA